MRLGIRTFRTPIHAALMLSALLLPTAAKAGEVPTSRTAVNDLPANVMSSDRKPARSRDATALNPQPLPPKAANAAQSQVLPTATKGSQTSIIIVSGEQGKPAHAIVPNAHAPKVDGKVPSAETTVQH